MAEIWGLALAAGATVYSSRQAGKAADAQARASGQAVDAMAEAEQRALQLQEPFYEAGYAATAAMMDMTGLDRSKLGGAARIADAENRGRLIGDTLLPEGTTTVDKGKGWYDVFYDGKYIGYLKPGGPNGRFVNETDFNAEAVMREKAEATAYNVPGDLSSYGKYDWKQDPGYQFRMDEGMKAIERSAAARGVLGSGGTLRGATRFAQDYASNEYQKVFDRISTIAGRGQSSASQGAQTIVNTGANVGNALVNAGEARASGYIAQGNAWANLGNQIGMAAGYGMFGKIGGQGSGAWGSSTSVPGTMYGSGGYIYNVP